MLREKEPLITNNLISAVLNKLSDFKQVVEQRTVLDQEDYLYGLLTQSNPCITSKFGSYRLKTDGLLSRWLNSISGDNAQTNSVKATDG